MRRAPGRREQRLASPALWFLAFFAFFTSGCLTLTSTLRPDGSSTIDMRYQVDVTATEKAERARFTSPHFAVEAFTVATSPKAEAHVKGTLDDATKLSSIPFFRMVSVTRTREGDEEELTLVVTKEKPMELPAAPGPAITLTLPGPVVKAEPKAEVQDATVTWRFPLDAFAREKTTTMTVRWKAPPAAAAAAPAAAAKPTADAVPSAPPTTTP